jgi:hypothetical protein
MLDTLSHKRALSDGVLDLKTEPLDAFASFMVRFYGSRFGSSAPITLIM